MKHNKLFSMTIVLSMIAFFTMGWMPAPPPPKPAPVTITAVYDFSTFPLVWGTFTTGGALTISGTTSMDVNFLAPEKVAHCVVTLIASDGTITIHQQCEFSTVPAKGRWQIVSGTGAYANLKGNGSLTMPPDTELMVGFIR